MQVQNFGIFGALFVQKPLRELPTKPVELHRRARFILGEGSDAERILRPAAYGGAMRADS